jgi:hypothetical protein
VLLATVGLADAQGSSALVQITELCGTSNMQAIGSSAFAGGEGSRFASLRCEPDIGGYIVQIFNGAGSINCKGSLEPAVQDYIQFSVSMSCTGPENNGNGVTGSIKIPSNQTSNTFSSVVNIPFGLTSDEIPVLLDNQDLAISGRTCNLVLLADLRAKNPADGKCVNCLVSTTFTATDTCGALETKTTCGFFDLVCHFDQGTWDESAFFWILFDLIIFMLIPVFAYAIILNNRRLAERRLFHRALAAELRTNSSYTKKQYMSDVLDNHGQNFNHGGSRAIKKSRGDSSRSAIRRRGGGKFNAPTASSSSGSGAGNVRGSSSSRRRTDGYEYVA